MEIKIILCLEESTVRFFSKKLGNMEQMLHEIINKENTIMSQIDDLNKAISDEDVQIQDVLASVTKVDADIDALLAKIAAGGATFPDITTQLTAIAAHTAALSTAAAQMTAEDAKANPPA